MILSTEDFIKRAYCVHGDRYNYKLVDYKNIKSKRIYKNNINTYIKWAKEDNIMGKITDFLNEMRGGKVTVTVSINQLIVAEITGKLIHKGVMSDFIVKNNNGFISMPYAEPINIGHVTSNNKKGITFSIKDGLTYTIIG